MSGLSLASHPLLAGAGRHTAQTPLFARFSCACPACPLLGFRLLCFMPVAPARHAGSRAHTLVSAHTCWCGRFSCVRVGACLVGACCGRVCSRVAGLRFFVFAWVFAFSGCWRVCLGWWGVLCPAAPCPPCLLACSRSGVGGFGVCAVLCARWAEGGNVGAGHGCPAPCSVALGCFGRPVARREAWRVGCSHGVLTRARTRAERWERRGEPRGADRGGLGGGCGWWRVGW